VILYIIDSRCLPAHIKQVGEGLYHLLTQPSLLKRKTRVKILCNKSDLDDSKSAQQACSLLEKELDRIRASKSTDMLDQEDEEKEYLGYEGEVFSFDHLTTPVTWKSVSFKEDNVDIKFMFDLYQ
jgi:signal recognition particle receptor subunit beta